MAFEKEIKILEQAEKERKPVEPISDLVPGGLSLEDAHAICEASVQKRLASGEKLAGFKVGFTNIAVREKMGFPDCHLRVSHGFRSASERSGRSSKRSDRPEDRMRNLPQAWEGSQRQGPHSG